MDDGMITAATLPTLDRVHATPLAAPTLEQAERSLIDAALAGDGRAFAELVRPHLPMLYRVAARGCGKTMAEDAVQETLSIAFQRLSNYTPGTALKSWLASIAAQRAWTAVRGEIRRRARESAAAITQDPTTPEEDLRATQLAKRINEALAKLPDKRRQAALLRLDAGLSYSEIATAIDSTEGSARVMVHMALRALRAELGDLLQPDGGPSGHGR